MSVIKAFTDKFKVIAVDLLLTADQETILLAATSEDGLVRVWDVNPVTLQHSETFREHRAHREVRKLLVHRGRPAGTPTWWTPTASSSCRARRRRASSASAGL